MNKIIAFVVAFAVVAVASPALAAGDISVRNTNSASILNTVSSVASTGGNTSDGASAMNHVSGGSVYQADASNKAGNGGNTVLGGMGGEVRTGNAVAVAGVSNTVNSNRTSVRTEPWATGEIKVRTHNDVELANLVITGATTGDNVSNGETAHNRLRGGNVTESGYANVAGNGGNHVEGGNGGEVVTGHAQSESAVVNVLNRTITRIRK